LEIVDASYDEKTYLNYMAKGENEMKDLKTVLIICEELLNKGYVDAVKEILKEVNHVRTREISFEEYCEVTKKALNQRT